MAQQCVQQNGQQHQPAQPATSPANVYRARLWLITAECHSKFESFFNCTLHGWSFAPRFLLARPIFALLCAQSARVSCHHSHLHWRVPYTACHISISHGSCWCFLPILLRIPSDKLKAHYFTPSCALTHCGAILRTRRLDRFKQHASRKHAPDIGNYLVRCLYAWHSRVRNNNNNM